MVRDSLEFDLLIVGGGVAGLSAAIRAKQLQPALSVALIDKGAEIGAHILSGAVMDPVALNELIPAWREHGAPLRTAVTEDSFLLLSEKRGIRVPNGLLPESLRNDGNYIISLGELCRWLSEQAVAAGVDIFSGFVAAELLYGDDDGAVVGVVTGELGVGTDGAPTSVYQMGVELRARYTLFAEGCRGHLGKQLEEQFNLREGVEAQSYSLGVKELWSIPEGESLHQEGLVMHTVGWPLDRNTYGGSFCYHYTGPGGERLISIGQVVGLDYCNPTLSPFEEMQRLKQHPLLKPMLDGGERIGYGARTLVTGGLQALPKMIFPGGALIGDDAGVLVAARIKGSHAAIKTGMLAAEAAVEAIDSGREEDKLSSYPDRFRSSWLYEELYRNRNFKGWLSYGLHLGGIMFGIEQQLLRGRAPWTLKLRSAHSRLLSVSDCRPIEYPQPDGVVSFDRSTSLYLSNVNHRENQPCHLKILDSTIAGKGYDDYGAPEQYYCPAGVFEYSESSSGEVHQLLINAQNCLHCKTCDIRDPAGNIEWTPPDGGEGPIYLQM